MADEIDKFCIVVTGLPASGKTTIGKNIANILDIPYIDKDDILEDLFKTNGIGDSNHRQLLSRHSDKLFQQHTKILRKSVLISHWQPSDYSINSGTPTGWIADIHENIIELYCDCPVDLATNRFKLRIRHPGHLDEQKSATQILQWMQDYQRFLPLNLGELVHIDTSNTINHRKLIQQIQSTLSISKIKPSYSHK